MIKDLKLSPTEIAVVLRLANYKNKDDDKTVFEDIGGAKISWNDKKKRFRKVITPELNSEKGYLVKEQIEHATKDVPCPYNHPRSTRGKVLDDSLCNSKEIIVIRQFEFRDNRGREGDYKIYCIEQDITTFTRLFSFFYNHANKEDFYKFIASDYYLEFKNEFLSVSLEGLEEEDKKFIKNQPMISPSWVMSNIQEHSFDFMRNFWAPDRTPTMTTLYLTFGFNQVYLSFLMNDLVNCPNIDLRKQYFELILKISHKKKYENVNKVMGYDIKDTVLKDNKEALEGIKTPKK